MKGKKLLYIIIAIAVVLAAGLLWQGRGGTEVDTIQAQTGSITIAVEDTALVQAAEDYNIYATQNARLKTINVETGQLVEKNQLIMQLENPELQLQLSENRSLLAQSQASAASASAGVKRLELQLEDARSNAFRNEELFKQGAISRSDYDQSVLLLNTAQEALNEQKSYLDTLQSQITGMQDSLGKLLNLEKDLQVYSPIEGIILSLPVKTGQTTAPGVLLATIVAEQDLEIKADILSDDLAGIEIGQKVSVTAPVLGDKLLEGIVVKIYPQAEEKMSALGVIQRRVPILISINDKANLKPGYEVRVAIQTQHLENALILPIESVRKNNNGKPEVLLIKDKQIKFQEVETGLSDSNNIEIKSGIKEGDLLVRDASLELKENIKVKPID
ncbi:putative co/zn/cd efflux system membrane fusion protein [hydrocarbon metagenome]|uniref:Putative co/zn/cd efflux system membrane fusion protein n=1 Tax=hydrocarbon metagenome TaxID=938273 RepID=A0A0W8E136_9ZZZZ